ncbi:MAG: GatB/YqeY domain-containing protein [candidate division Zixibacteria bacterium]|nr:GatB/YqeY domain-containing protein [candidate division Zixibacteria bacterium]MDH3936938.1 GatB/YqeY domain-containing protein [candidate division Zixibacteria bacterium]MDH4033918.1 GatB/YqeY domain-containing protein [candidate division Zixibacteria bacterium]
MSLFERIDKDTIEALKAGEKDLLTLLRGLKSDLKYARLDKGDDLTDQDVIGVLASQAKKRRDSIEQFEKGGRDDLVAKERAELEIITTYLPKQLTEGELREIITKAISETGAESPAQLGAVMKIVVPQTKGLADGKLVSKLALEILAN